MKYIKEIKVDVNQFIKKDFLKKVKIDELKIQEMIYIYSSSKKIGEIISERINDFKKYIEETDPNDYKNIKNYDIHYDLIVEKFLDQQYLINKKEVDPKFTRDNDFEDIQNVYDLSVLNPLFFKSSKYAFLFLENKKYYTEDKLDPDVVKKLEKTILTNIELSYNYAKKILEDRWEELELRIIEKEKEPHFRDYLNDVLKYFFENDIDPSKKFNEFYNNSNVFKKFINHPLTIKNGLSSFTFWNSNIDKILNEYPESYIEYYYAIYNKDDFEKDLLKMKENIMKDPEKISLYYADADSNTLKQVNLPNDPVIRQKIFNALSQYPKHMIFFAYTRYKKNDNDIFRDFPNFINDALKNEDLHMFYYFLEKIFFQKTQKMIKDIKDHLNNFLEKIVFQKTQKMIKDIKGHLNNNEVMKEVRDYMYQTYKPFIEKISDNPYYAINYAKITNYPFPIKEGEQKILNSMLQRTDYLIFIKDLGPSVVPNYDEYDFSIINQQQNDLEDID